MVVELVVLCSIALIDTLLALFALWWNKKYFVKQLHRRGVSFVFLGFQLFFTPFIVIYFTNPYDMAAFLCTIIGIWLFSTIMWAILFFFCIYIKGNLLIKKTLFRKIEIVLTDEGTYFKRGIDGIPVSKVVEFITHDPFQVVIVSADGTKEISFNTRHMGVEGDINKFFKDIEMLVPPKETTKKTNKTKLKFNECIVVTVRFDSTKRKSMPILNKLKDGRSYRPHFVVEGTTEYLGVEFIESDLDCFDKEGDALVRAAFYGRLEYEKMFQKGTQFSIMEGSNKVGSGIVKGRPNF